MRRKFYKRINCIIIILYLARTFLFHVMMLHGDVVTSTLKVILQCVAYATPPVVNHLTRNNSRFIIIDGPNTKF